jgi:hypothetical protein
MSGWFFVPLLPDCLLPCGAGSGPAYPPSPLSTRRWKGGVKSTFEFVASAAAPLELSEAHTRGNCGTFHQLTI